jgi:hypothetical protein
MSFEASKRPRVRCIEPLPVAHNGRQLIHLRDPHRFVESGLTVSPAAYWIISMMSGHNSVEEIRDRFNSSFNANVSLDDIELLVKTLDENFLLENDRFEELKKKTVEEFLSQSVRGPALAGKSYPEDAGELSRMLDGFLDTARSSDSTPPYAVIAPHIGLAAGGATFGAAYSRLSGSDAETFVILGTGHTLTEDFFACVDKDFETPLGVSPVDREFLGELEKEFAEPIYKNGFAHKYEHSVEFQVLFLQKLFGNADPPRKIVPILLSLPETIDESDHPEFNSERINRFTSALRKAINKNGRKVCLIAGIDLSHVGKRFGQMQGAPKERLNEIKNEDSRLLQFVAGGMKTEFVELMKRINPRNHVCGFPVLYVLMDLLDGRKGELLDYRQNVEGDNDSVVSFAAMTFR